ncbi:MAG TPA: hypothetical protein VH743_05085 [Beijerinckiaceae bacterium]|jgi:hypothetical protein
MRALKILAMVAAIIGGALSLSGAPASAEALNPASPAATAARTANAAWAYHRYGHRAYYHRRYYRPRHVYYARPYYYRPVRYGYRPRVVCRWRHTIYGTRRVCARRW